MLKRLCVVALALCAGCQEDLMQQCKNGDSKTCAELVRVSEQGCNEGNAVDCHNAAFLFGTGQGIRIDYAKAQEYYQKACDGGVAESCFNLGLMYDDNGKLLRLMRKAKEKVHINPKALEYFGKACDLGMQEGCDSYKEIYLYNQ